MAASNSQFLPPPPSAFVKHNFAWKHNCLLCFQGTIDMNVLKRHQWKKPSSPPSNHCLFCRFSKVIAYEMFLCHASFTNMNCLVNGVYKFIWRPQYVWKHHLLWGDKGRKLCTPFTPREIMVLEKGTLQSRLVSEFSFDRLRFSHSRAKNYFLMSLVFGNGAYRIYPCSTPELDKIAF